MGSTLDLGAFYLRGHNTDGVPASGPNRPRKSEGIAAFRDADTRLGTLETSSGNSIVQDTWQHLLAIVGAFKGQRAEVFTSGGTPGPTHTDPVVGGTVQNIGIYAWSVSPAGWQWISADALSSKAPINSPSFTGVPIAPTAPVDTNTTQIATTAFVIGQASTRAPLASPAFTGTPTTTTPPVDDNSTRVANTAWFFGQAGVALPLINGTANAGTSPRWARVDHVHPTDTTRAPLASPGLTGTPTAPTPPVDDNSILIATTQWVIGQAANYLPFADGVAYAGTSSKLSRGDHVHPSDTTRAPANFLAFAQADAAAAFPSGTYVAALPDVGAIAAVNGDLVGRFVAIFGWMLGNAAFRDVATPLSFGDVVDLAASSTIYYGIGRNSSTAGRAVFIANRTGTLRDLRAGVDLSPGAGGGITLTLMKNGVASVLATTIAGGTSAIDNVHEVTCVAGDLFELRAVANASAVTTHALSATITLGV